jgi:hypothetical protein
MSRITCPLTIVVPITLNASGNGTAQAGPPFNHIWSPVSCSIQAAGGIPTGANPATCTLLVGNSVSSSVFVDETYQVTGAASSVISGQLVNFGQYIFAVFANCNPSVPATLTIYGTTSIPG